MVSATMLIGASLGSACAPLQGHAELMRPQRLQIEPLQGSLSAPSPVHSRTPRPAAGFHAPPSLHTRTRDAPSRPALAMHPVVASHVLRAETPQARAPDPAMHDEASPAEQVRRTFPVFATSVTAAGLLGAVASYGWRRRKRTAPANQGAGSEGSTLALSFCIGADMKQLPLSSPSATRAPLWPSIVVTEVDAGWQGNDAWSCPLLSTGKTMCPAYVDERTADGPPALTSAAGEVEQLPVTALFLPADTANITPGRVGPAAPYLPPQCAGGCLCHALRGALAQVDEYSVTGAMLALRQIHARYSGQVTQQSCSTARIAWATALGKEAELLLGPAKAARYQQADDSLADVDLALCMDSHLVAIRTSLIRQRAVTEPSGRVLQRLRQVATQLETRSNVTTELGVELSLLHAVIHSIVGKHTKSFT